MNSEKIENLIETLVADSQKEKKPEGIHGYYIPGFILFCILLLEFSYLPIRPGFDWEFLFPIVSLLVAGVGLFFYAAPGLDKSLRYLLFFFSIWLGLRFGLWIDSLELGSLSRSEFWILKHIFCPSHLILYSFPLVYIGYRFVRSYFPTSPIAVLILLGIGSAGFGETILNLFCPDRAREHLLVWHFLPWILPLFYSVLYFRNKLRW